MSSNSRKLGFLKSLSKSENPFFSKLHWLRKWGSPEVGNLSHLLVISSLDVPPESLCHMVSLCALFVGRTLCVCCSTLNTRKCVLQQTLIPLILWTLAFVTIPWISLYWERGSIRQNLLPHACRSLDIIRSLFYWVYNNGVQISMTIPI